MRACATGLRTMEAHSMPGSGRLSTKRPWPMTSGASSLRSMRDPMYPPVWTEELVSVLTAPSSGLSRSAHGGGRALDCLDDVLVAGTAAEVPLQPEADLPLVHAGAALDETEGGHDHPGRAVAALQAVVLAEGLLQGVQLAVRGESLDREDVAAVGLDGEHRAGLHRPAVHHHRAGTARRGVAADIRARQPQRLSKEVDEELAWLHVGLPPNPVDRASDVPQRATSLASRAIAPALRDCEARHRTGFAPLHPIPLADEGFASWRAE